MKRTIPLLFLILLYCEGKSLAQKTEFKIGFSQCVSEDLWRKSMEREMEIEASLHPEVKLITRDAGGSSEQQVRDVKAFLKEKIDLLIISPNESDPLTPIVEEVYNSGVPVVVIDRQISSDAWTAYIGADNYEIGYQAGNHAATILNGNGFILEITGLEGSSPAISRHNGFIDAIKEFPDIQVNKSVTGMWNWADGKRVMDSILNTGYRPDLVFSHNDFMAAGAYEAARENGVEDQFFFFGIDGMAKGGIEYVIEGKLDATWLYPTGGDVAIDVALRILEEKPFERINKLETLLIDKRNANTLKLQNQQLESLQEKISRLREIAGDYRQQFSNLRRVTILVSLFAFMVLALIVAVIKAYRAKNNANRALAMQNMEIEKQNAMLQQISEQLKIATGHKIKFFTNISHELRTPLTLITGPLEYLMRQGDLPLKMKKKIEIIYRNALRLLRLTNQLMDFRKLENDKMLLKTGYYDVKKFLTRIYETFEPLAERKKIRFELDIGSVSEKLWFDLDKMDKVMFNLLSNAIKFTSEGGKVIIGVRNTERNIHGKLQPVVEISVSDTGLGFSEEHLDSIFERFYQIENQHESNYFPGTGIGLSLTKGIIELHSGDIDVSSRKGEGSTFRIYLLQGSNHLTEEQQLTESNLDQTDLQSAQMISEELSYLVDGYDDEMFIEESKPVNSKKQHLILLVEDNPDLLNYMRDILTNEYEIMTAKDGVEAWEIIQADLPDIVVSDIMMPRMNGLDLTQHIRKEQSTCHIPVILLTARISIENKLEGLEAGADAYIPKPFNESHLLTRIRKLLEMRKLIAEHYREHLTFDIIKEGVDRMDQHFLDRTNSIITQNIGEQDFGVKELSREVGMSRVHLYRKIKQITELSVSEYIRSIKLSYAKNLISKGELTISEVAYEAGFSNPSYFTKSFKNQFHLTPSEYQSQITKNLDS